MSIDATDGEAAAYKTLATSVRRSARVAFDTPDGAPARFDLCCPEGHLGWAKAMGEGALKHGPGNWMQGMPFSELINRVEAHMAAFKAGDRSEDHVGHCMANLFMLAYFARHRPDLDDRRPSQRPGSPTDGSSWRSGATSSAAAGVVPRLDVAASPVGSGP